MRRLAALLLLLPLAATLCPGGAVQGTRPKDCYLYGSAQSWQEAEQYCAANKGHLSSVPNGFVNVFLISNPEATESAQSYWLGARSTLSSLGTQKYRSTKLQGATDKWTWTDGSDFIFSMWATGEPKLGPGCLSVDVTTGQWHSGECGDSKSFVCKIPPSCQSAQQKCDDGWTFNEKLKKCFKTLSGLFNWDTAYAACRDEGADLPSIHSAADNIAFVLEVIRDYPLVILGLRNTAVSPWLGKSVLNYMWTDGSFVNYSQLHFVDDDTIYPACVYFQTAQTGETDQWITMDCLVPTKMATAVCQKSPKKA